MVAESKHVIKFRARQLKSGEKVVAWGEGYIGALMGKGKDTQHTGVLIVTESRVAFYRKGIFREVIETLPLKAISFIERKSFMGHQPIRLHTSHDVLDFKPVKKDQYQALVDAIEEGCHGGAQPARVQVQPADNHAMAALTKLGKLTLR